MGTCWEKWYTCHGSKGGGGSRSGTPVTGNRPPAAVPCRGRPFTSCIPKPPKKCNTPFQRDCPSTK
ncbi:hypothetical protein QQP08_012544 [Theobroma cacao]|nr:hypothetical protein QQP08_012544 [Theobroma cacao]